MSQNGRCPVQGLYVRCKNGKWNLIAQLSDNTPVWTRIWQAKHFYRLWRTRAELVGEHRIRVIRSRKAFITKQDLERG